MSMSYPKLKHNVESTSDGDSIVYVLNDELKDDLSKICNIKLNDTSKLSITPSDLYELFSSIKLGLLNRLNNAIIEIIL